MNPRKRTEFDVESFLASLGIVATIKDFRRNEVLFSQGNPITDVLYFIRKGSVKRSVVSPSGKERIVSILGRGDFLGAWCLFDHPVRPATTSAILPTSVLVITKKNLVRALHEHDLFSDRFIVYVLARWIRLEDDLISQLFNSSEKRLARLLIQLSQNGQTRKSEMAMPNVSQQQLAEMIGASRQQVNGLMNKFRKLGYIEYNSNGGLNIHRSLSQVSLWE